MYPFELVQGVATTWCLSGLRGDEIRRLRVGCIYGVRRNRSRGMRRDPAERWPLFPFGPVNETGTAFAKPVQRAVGKRILTGKPTSRCEIPWAKLRLTARGQRLRVHFITRPRDSIPLSWDSGSVIRTSDPLSIAPSCIQVGKSIARANKNSRLIQVLVDPTAAAKGEPAIFYYLDGRAYCANPAWAC